ncbi:MAG: DUF255 domain-containing protein [Candidatus Acidiferrum sp.]|jgi:uncharacterized protein YyaL (SSP411 family)
MKTLFSFLLSFLLVLPTARAQESAAKSSRLAWQPWSESVFAQAKEEKRFVLLDLEAVWCHWCHVMDENTYSDPAVVKMLREHYIVVKADQDSRPDLSNRYEDYGWPATVVFHANGQEIVKRQGYLAPDEMLSMLQAILDDPTPGPSVRPEAKLEVPANALLTEPLRLQLNKNYLAGYDRANGSWGTDQKLLDWDSVEYSLVLAKLNRDTEAEHMARQTLTAQLHLLDPAWGGVYQYSTDGDWNHPHFEKIMQMQAENLRIYSLAYAQFGDPGYLHAAQEIRRYLKTFLTSPEGAFYTSQDADLIDGKHGGEYFALNDAARRKQGVPRVDQHIYARENGWAINGLVALYDATGDADLLNDARRAAKWILANRALPGGGFRHNAKDAAGPYLGDTIAMARAFLSLYGATGDRAWLAHAESSIHFADKNFRDANSAGFLTSKTPTDLAYVPRPQRDENVLVARTANLLFHFTGDTHYEDLAKFAMKYLSAVPIVNRLPASSALLPDLELNRAPLHLTVVGRKDDPASQALFQAALRSPSSYKRVEWWDTREGKLPNPDVQYPELPRAAAFICTNRACSAPIFKPEDLQPRIDKLSGLQASR